MDPLPAGQAPQTVTDIMALCGLPNAPPANANVPTVATYVAAEVFMDSFEKCIDMTDDEVGDELKTLRNNPVAPLYITAAMTTKIQAFVEWTKQCFRCGFDPTTTIFPVQNSVSIIRQGKIHAEFVSKAKMMATTAKPPPFKASDDWANWSPLLINYLRQLPGRDGVPLSYVLRDEENPVYDPEEADIQEKYIRAVPLNGPTFQSDTLQVHTYIANLIAGNVQAEAAIQRYRRSQCGRADYAALKAVYEGVGAYSVDKVNAERTLKTLFYSGEKGREHNWASFQQKLLRAFTTFELHAAPGVVVHDTEARIKILLEKVASCDFLKPTAANIKRDLARPNCNGLTFEQALSELQNDVTTLGGRSNSYNNPQNRRIQNTNSDRNRNRGHPYGLNNQGRGNGRRNNGNNNRGGNGRGGRGRGRGNGGNNTRNHPEAYTITLQNGQKISAHPSYKFTDEEFQQMHPHDKRAIIEKRAAYNASKNNTRAISQTATAPAPLTFNIPPNADAATVISALTTQLQAAQTATQPLPHDAYTITINQARTENHTPFGGRNEEAARRGNRHIAHFTSTRNDTRTIQSARKFAPAPNLTAANECDSNADTCCVGTNFAVIQYTHRSADVYPYNSAYAPVKNIPIVSAGTAWTDPRTNETIILVLHECLYYGTSLDHTLWNPNQLRHNGVVVHDNPYDHGNHRLTIEVNDIIIPLHTSGTKVQFFSRSPTEDEIMNCRHVELTSINPWNPRNVVLGAVATATATPGNNVVLHPFTSESLLQACSPALVQLKECVISHIRISSTVSSLDTTLEGTEREGTLPEPILGFGDIPARRTFTSSERHLSVSAENLAELWQIGEKQGDATIRCTQQRGTRSAILPLHRRYRSDRQVGLNRLNSKFATDTLYADVESLEGFKYAQIYTNKCGFSAVYPMKRLTGDELGETLKDFANEHGVPEHLTYDGAAAQTGPGTLFQKMVRKYDIVTHVSGKERPNENPAEGGIRQLKMKYYRAAHRRNVPPRLWNYGMKWVSEIGNITANSSKYSKGRTPLEVITGETPDISEYLDFGFYDYCSYLPNAGLAAPKLGRWLGVSHRIGKLMSYWVLPESEIPISCTTVQRVTRLELQTDEYKARIKHYEEKLSKRMKTKEPIQIPSNIPEDCQLGLLEYESQAFLDEFQRVIDNPDVPHGIDDKTSEDEGQYTDMRLSMKRNRDGKLVAARVRGRAEDENGQPLGRGDENPLLDMRQYVIEYIDGESEVVTANVIAENLLTQVDDNGYGQRQLDDIIDHRTTDHAVPIHDGWTTSDAGTRRRKITTKGWEIFVQWRDGSTDWVALKDLKASYPVELAEYAVKRGIQDMPAFAYWVPYTLKKRSTIISKLKSKYWERTHKYGVKIPKNMAEAIRFDEENGNTLWYDAIRKEMKNVRVAFQEFTGNIEDLKKDGYEQITCHIIFDVKLSEGFRRKARFVADGHKVETPPSISYSSVVARDSVRICLLLAALNNLNVLCVDIQNAYLTAPNREKVFTKAGPEFGDESGKWMLIVRALYGLRGAGASFRSFLASKLDEMGFVPCVADPDVWMRAAIKPDGTEYYEYILCYVDDILCVSAKAESTLKELGESFKFKNDEIKEPDMYLGATLRKRTLNGKERWSITSDEYLKAAVENLENQLKRKGKALPKGLTTPTNVNIIFELDDSRLLDAEEIVHYQELIGILRWATELGRIDILLEVSLLSSYSAMPRWNHLMQVYQIFAYIKKVPKFSLYMSPELPAYETITMQRNTDNFREHYRDAEEVLPRQMPKPRGNTVTISAYVDASHAGDKATRRSHTGVQIFVNRAPVMWFSKKQPTVETSAFASEYTAMKTCIEMIVGLRYKLRMMGIPLDDEPSKVFCDNGAVVLNSSEFSSTLSKKHNSVAYHMTRWHVAAGIVEVIWVPTNQNLADAFTKRLSKYRRDELFGNISYY